MPLPYTDVMDGIDQSSLTKLLESSSSKVLPSSFVTIMSVSFVVLTILSILFTIAYIFGIVRKWKVQSAVLHMEKDLAEIKAKLATNTPVHDQIAPPKPQLVDTPPSN